MIRETERERGMYRGLVVRIPGLMYYCDLRVINQTPIDTRPHKISHTHLYRVKLVSLGSERSR